MEPLLRARFMAWAISPENNRAPGMTCLRAIGRLADGTAGWIAEEALATPVRSPERRTAWMPGRPTGKSSTPKN